MKRLSFVLKDNYELLNDAFLGLLKDGYVRDPDLSLIKFDNYAIMFLVKYESEDEKPKPEVKVSSYDNVESIISVDIGEADSKLKEGYTILEHYVKTVTLIKRRKIE